MRVAIVQSNYIPWRGYFDMIASVDLFVLFDDAQYTRRDWRNRNKIKTPRGPVWLTVPVHDNYGECAIDEVTIDHGREWAEKHLAQLDANYRAAPFYKNYIDALAAILKKNHAHLAQLNLELIKWVMQELGLATKIQSARGLGAPGKKTERLLNILQAVGATDYLSGPSAKDYMDVDLLKDAGIGLSYKTYDYPPYPQLHGAYEQAISILDTLFMLGPEAHNACRGHGADERVLESKNHPVARSASF